MRTLWPPSRRAALMETSLQRSLLQTARNFSLCSEGSQCTFLHASGAAVLQLHRGSILVAAIALHIGLVGVQRPTRTPLQARWSSLLDL